MMKEAHAFSCQLKRKGPPASIEFRWTDERFTSKMGWLLLRAHWELLPGKKPFRNCRRCVKTRLEPLPPLKRRRDRLPPLAEPELELEEELFKALDKTHELRFGKPSLTDVLDHLDGCGPQPSSRQSGVGKRGIL